MWGQACERFLFVKVPVAFIRLVRYAPESDKRLARKLKPNHYRLLLALATCTNKKRPLAPHWERLAEDLGLTKSAVRKLGYELRALGLLGVTQRRGRVAGAPPGVRNDSNVFDLAPFVDRLLLAACRTHDAEWRTRRARGRGSRG